MEWGIFQETCRAFLKAQRHKHASLLCPLKAAVFSLASTLASACTTTHSTSHASPNPPTSKKGIFRIRPYCIFGAYLKAFPTSGAKVVIYVRFSITHGYCPFNGTGFYAKLTSNTIAFFNPWHLFSPFSMKGWPGFYHFCRGTINHIFYVFFSCAVLCNVNLNTCLVNCGKGILAKAFSY